MAYSDIKIARLKWAGYIQRIDNGEIMQRLVESTQVKEGKQEDLILEGVLKDTALKWGIAVRLPEIETVGEGF